MAFEPPDNHYFAAAVGWLELGNPKEAKVEIEQISPAQQKNPDVLEVHWQICAELKLWEEGLHVARALLHNAPHLSSGWLHQAYALRRLEGAGLPIAWEALLPAAKRFSSEPLVAYNLACYACQLGKLDVGREWFRRALSVGRKEALKKMALGDADLEPLWGEIRDM